MKYMFSLFLDTETVIHVDDKKIDKCRNDSLFADTVVVVYTSVALSPKQSRISCPGTVVTSKQHMSLVPMKKKKKKNTKSQHL